MMREALTETEVALSQENTDLRRQVEEAKAEIHRYGEWTHDLQAQVEALGGAAAGLLGCVEARMAASRGGGMGHNILIERAAAMGMWIRKLRTALAQAEGVEEAG